MEKLIAIVGPTASGKTALGIYLAQKLSGEVVSADSRQVYKGLDIGTGKATKKEMAGISHHLIDIASPKRQFTAEEFVRKADRAVARISQHKKIPIVVGGTGFYIDALAGRLSLPNVPPNPTLRKILAKKSAAQLLAQLRWLDPRRAAEVDPHNKVRLIRSIEIAKVLGAVPAAAPTPRYRVLWLGLNPRNINTRIRQRLRARLAAGMVAEAKRLHVKGLSYKRMEELGLEYRYLARFLKGQLTRAQFETELEREIVRYAKRQMRWFTRNKDIHWVGSPGRAGKTEALRLAKAFLNNTDSK